MFIKAISVENFKGIEQVTIRPGERGLILVGGRNAQGKSSLLDGIAATLGGKRLLPERPIRDGSSKAELSVELDGPGGSLTVTRTLTERSDRLEVRNKDGFKLSSPQAALDRLYGAIAFDPLAFEASDAKAQREMLLRALGVGDELDKLEYDRMQLYTQRRDVNRDLKRARTEMEAIPEVSPVPARVDTAALRATLAEAAEAKRKVSVAQARLDGLRAKHASTMESVQQMKRRVDDLQRQLDAARADLETGNSALVTAQDRIDDAEMELSAMAVPDTFSVEMELDGADTVNAAAARVERDNAARQKAEAMVSDLAAKSAALDARLQAIEDAKRSALASVELPIPGLALAQDVVDEDGRVTAKGGVVLDGIPFSQCAASKRLKASFAIVAALKPELRVALCRHGERLDSESIEELAAFAEASYFQLFVERVGTSDDGAIVIEAGKVKEV